MNPIAALGTLADDLRSAIRGAVAFPGDPAYDEARFAHHANIDQRPAAVVIPADADDVSSTVRIARAHGLRVTAQAGGHGATSSMENCVLIRSHDLRSISIDPESRRALVGAGVRWGEVHAESVGYGLHGVCGTAPDISVVGYCLGGGISWFARKYGYGANSVTAIELVEGDGTQRRVTPYSDPDLFYALRGGGGNLGIVTAIEVELKPADAIYGGLVTWAGADAAALLRAYRDLTATLPEETTTQAVVMHLPSLPAVPPELQGQCVFRVGIAHLGTEAEARALLQPLFDVAEPMLDETRPVPIDEIGEMAQEPPMPRPVELATELVSDLDDEALERIVDLAGPGSGTPLLFVQIRHLGGELGRSPERASVADRVDEPFMVYALGIPMGGPGHAAAIRSALDAFGEALAPVATGGAPLTFLPAGESLHRVYTDEQLVRLRSAKADVDPDDVLVGNFELPAA